MLVVCERWVGDGDRLLHIDSNFFWPQQHFFRVLAGLLNRGSLRAQNPLSAAGSQFCILSPTDSNCNSNWHKPSVSPGYITVLHPPASAAPPLIYRGASLDWRLGRGSICYTLNWWNTRVVKKSSMPHTGFRLSTYRLFLNLHYLHRN